MRDISELVFEKTLAFTGHRPDRLFGYDYRNKGNMMMLLKLRAVIERLIIRRGIDTFVTGMALGVDMWSAQIIITLKKKYPQIKLVCAVPCANHSIRWNEEDQIMHKEILEQADFVYYVSEEPYTNWCMNVRNRWMVDNAKIIVAVWDGTEDGGTWDTVKYTRKRQRTMVEINPQTLEVKLTT